jgi:hypothetical protein
MSRAFSLASASNPNWSRLIRNFVVHPDEGAEVGSSNNQYGDFRDLMRDPSRKATVHWVDRLRATDPAGGRMRCPINRYGSRAIRAGITFVTASAARVVCSPGKCEHQADKPVHTNTPCLLYVVSAPAKADLGRHHADADA